MNRLIKLLIVGWSCVMLGASLLLMREYCYLVDQSYKLIALKAEYENHLMAVSRIIYEYNTLRDRSDYTESAHTDDEKKNEKNQSVNSTAHSFPDGARVVSSSDVSSKDDFLVVNRELRHLKKSTMSYMQKHKIGTLGGQYAEHISKKSPKKRPAQSRKKATVRDRIVRAHKKKLHAIKREYGAADFTLSWPVDRSSLWLSSLFGPRKKANGSQGFHAGIDMATCKGTPVHAAASGIVVEVRREKDSRGYGNTIVIAHTHKYRTRYAHLHTMKVQVGQQVDRGQLIGTVGDTGLVRSRGKDASHLHFEVHMFGKKVDPLAFLS